mgnify:CR=1 FL=1
MIPGRPSGRLPLSAIVACGSSRLVLDFLRIRGLALLDDVALEFEPGMNVLTGETGAGKSIIVDALTLLRGGRGRAELVREGAEAARVEAQFTVRANSVGIPVDDRYHGHKHDDLLERYKGFGNDHRRQSRRNGVHGGCRIAVFRACAIGALSGTKNSLPKMCRPGGAWCRHRSFAARRQLAEGAGMIAVMIAASESVTYLADISTDGDGTSNGIIMKLVRVLLLAIGVIMAGGFGINLLQTRLDKTKSGSVETKEHVNETKNFVLAEGLLVAVWAIIELAHSLATGALS